MFDLVRIHILNLVLLLPQFAQAQRVLPEPSGPFSVGTVRIEMVDSTRGELSRANTDQVRRLMVQLWYPAKSGSANVREPYVPEMRDLAEGLRRTSPDLAVIMDSLSTGAFWDGAPLNELDSADLLAWGNAPACRNIHVRIQRPALGGYSSSNAIGCSLMHTSERMCYGNSRCWGQLPLNHISD